MWCYSPYVFFKNAKNIQNVYQLIFKMFSRRFSVFKPLSRRFELNIPCAELTSCMSERRGIRAWLTPVMMLAFRQAGLCVSPVPRLVHPQLLPTPLSYCHVAMATWEGPAFTTPGSQRRSLVWGKGGVVPSYSCVVLFSYPSYWWLGALRSWPSGRQFGWTLSVNFSILFMLKSLNES